MWRVGLLVALVGCGEMPPVPPSDVRSLQADAIEFTGQFYGSPTGLSVAVFDEVDLPGGTFEGGLSGRYFKSARRAELIWRAGTLTWSCGVDGAMLPHEALHDAIYMRTGDDDPGHTAPEWHNGTLTAACDELRAAGL
jgi:hypothetical protein